MSELSPEPENTPKISTVKRTRAQAGIPTPKVDVRPADGPLLCPFFSFVTSKGTRLTIECNNDQQFLDEYEEAGMPGNLNPVVCDLCSRAKGVIAERGLDPFPEKTHPYPYGGP